MATFRAYKYVICPTEEQRSEIEKTFAACRYVWNSFLERTTKAYRRRGESMTAFDCMKVLTEMKAYTPWLSGIGNHAMRYSIMSLDDARKAFFRRCKRGEKPGYPRFKSRKNPVQSFTTDGAIYVTGDYIQIPKVGRIRYRKNRGIEGTPVEVTVSRSATGKYFASVCCKVDILPMPVLDTKVGIDVGLKDFATTSDGEHYENPRNLANSLEKLAREQRKLSRKEKGSANWQRQKRKVARLYEQIANQRNDHHHKLSRKLVNENQVIAVEDLNIKGMVKNKKLAS